MLRYESDSDGEDLRDIDERSFREDKLKAEEDIESPSPLFARVKPNTTAYKHSLVVMPIEIEKYATQALPSQLD